MGVDDVRMSNFALRLQASLLNEASELAETEGVALNQFVNVAVAEKLSALRTEAYFEGRAPMCPARSPSWTGREKARHR